MNASNRLSVDFWKFWSGQTISNMGSSITMFALPLLVYRLTGSALSLALTTTFGFLPYLLFGLILGAWVDRIDRRRLMIAVDVAQALVIASIPLLYGLGLLQLWWVYVVVFGGGTLSIAFQAAEFAAIPSMVPQSDLVTANGRIQASYSAATIVGPLLAGLLLSLIPLEDLLYLDAASFAISAALLARIRRSFNAEAAPRSAGIRADIVEGLRYVWGHPVLRNISLMMALVNLLGSTVMAQLVLFVIRRYAVDEAAVGLFYSAGGAGVVVLSLAAGTMSQRFGFSKVALGALMLSGVALVALSITPLYWLGLLLWAIQSGLGILFNINTSSLRQAIVPSHMLGRVISVAMVFGLSAIPIGAILGGLIIERTGNVALVYGVIGVLTIIIPAIFALTPLGRADMYLPAAASASTEPGAAPAA
jgi:MFS family permease